MPFLCWFLLTTSSKQQLSLLPASYRYYVSLYFYKTNFYDGDGDCVNEAWNHMTKDPKSYLSHYFLCSFSCSKSHNNIIFAPGYLIELYKNSKHNSYHLTMTSQALRTPFFIRSSTPSKDQSNNDKTFLKGGIWSFEDFKFHNRTIHSQLLVLLSFSNTYWRMSRLESI